MPQITLKIVVSIVGDSREVVQYVPMDLGMLANPDNHMVLEVHGLCYDENDDSADEVMNNVFTPPAESDDDEEKEDTMTTIPIDRMCIACAGTGKSSLGTICYPCQGQGMRGQVTVAGAKKVPTATAPPAAPAKGKGRASETVASTPAKAKKVAPAPSSDEGEGAGEERQGRPRKEGLRLPQVRILKFMLAENRPVSRKEISAGAEVDVPFLSNWLGAHDPEVRAANEAKRGFKGLITLGCCKAEKHDVDGKDVVLYTITATGKKMLEKALKEEGE